MNIGRQSSAFAVTLPSPDQGPHVSDNPRRCIRVILRTTYLNAQCGRSVHCQMYDRLKTQLLEGKLAFLLGLAERCHVYDDSDQIEA
jgi:hypothetical protein